VWVGVDTHQRTHHAAVIDERGGVIADREFTADTAGYIALTGWAGGHGTVVRYGIESTGSYGAGLARALTTTGTTVVEVNSPNLQIRATQGKSDPIDAVMAARAAQSGRATVIPKDTTTVIESIRVLSVTRDSAVKARTAIMSQIRDLILTAPASLREAVDSATTRGRIARCRSLRPDLTRLADPVQATKHALRSLARRIDALDTEIAHLEHALTQLVTATAPTLHALPQVGTITAAQLLITAGANIDRIHNEAAFARLCGVAPIPASSGKTHRMRLSRSGDRQANKALHMITIGRLHTDPRSIAYLTRRTTEGLGKPDIIRCLKRYLVREIHHALITDLTTT